MNVNCKIEQTHPVVERKSFILTMREEDKIKFDDEIIVIKLKFYLNRRKLQKCIFNFSKHLSF